MSTEDSQRLEELESKERFGILTREEKHELKHLRKAQKSHCMRMEKVPILPVDDDVPQAEEKARERKKKKKSHHGQCYNRNGRG